eukprot:COSAG04_NODE_216_length_19953_cov_85.343558_13_plen_560_part_00
MNRRGDGTFTILERGLLALTHMLLQGSIQARTRGQLSAQSSIFNGAITVSGTLIAKSSALSSVTVTGMFIAQSSTFSGSLAASGGASLRLIGCGGSLTSLSVTDSTLDADTSTSLTLGQVVLNNAGPVALTGSTIEQAMTVAGDTQLGLSGCTLEGSARLTASGGSSLNLIGCSGSLADLRVSEGKIDMDAPTMRAVTFGSVMLDDAGPLALAGAAFAAGASLTASGGTQLTLNGCHGESMTLSITDTTVGVDAATTSASSFRSLNLNNAGAMTFTGSEFEEGASVTVSAGTQLGLIGCHGSLTSLRVSDSTLHIDTSTSLTVGQIDLNNAGPIALTGSTIEQSMTVSGDTQLSLTGCTLAASSRLTASGGGFISLMECSRSLADLRVTGSTLNIDTSDPLTLGQVNLNNATVALTGSTFEAGLTVRSGAQLSLSECHGRLFELSATDASVNVDTSTSLTLDSIDLNNAGPVALTGSTIEHDRRLAAEHERLHAGSLGQSGGERWWLCEPRRVPRECDASQPHRLNPRPRHRDDECSQIRIRLGELRPVGAHGYHSRLG